MKEEKKNILTNNAAVRFVRESYDELKKVVWPKRSEAIAMTIGVVITIVVSAALLAALDYGLSLAIRQIIGV